MILRSSFVVRRFFLPALLLVPLFPSGAAAQEVFREVTYSYGAPDAAHFSELDPETKRVFKGEHAGMARLPRHVPEYKK